MPSSRSRSTRRRTSSRRLTVISPKQVDGRRSARPVATVDRGATRSMRDGRALPSRPIICLESPGDGAHLAKLRGASVTDLIGLSLVGLVVLWLVVNFVKAPSRVHRHRPDRPHERDDLRPRRARLHARLRHPAADQLRPRRRLRALGPRREHRDRERPRARRRTRACAVDHRRPRDHARRDHGRCSRCSTPRSSGSPTGRSATRRGWRR